MKKPRPSELQKQQFVAKVVGEALAIAERLYASDKPRYKPLFPWIHKSIAQRRSAVLILQAMKSLEQKEATGHAALTPVEYAGGTLKRLEVEREAKRLRAGGAMESLKALDVFADMLRRSGYKVEKGEEQ
jgi:hypothetical protein